VAKSNIRKVLMSINLNYSLLSLFFFGVLLLFGIFLPASLLSVYLVAVFTWTIWSIVFLVDPVAQIPFALTKTQFSTGFAITLSVILGRLALSGYFVIPTWPIFSLLIAWWISVLIHFMLSESRPVSYFGTIERQMGLMYRLTIPVILFAGWQVYSIIGLNSFLLILLSAGIVETIVLTLQSLTEHATNNKKHFPFSFTYSTSIGFRRHTGTLSNPIPVANFLLLLLPLSLAFYHDFILFVVFYLVITWGLFLSHGRGSYLSSWLVSILSIIYISFLPQPWYELRLGYLVILLPLLIYLFTKQGQTNWSRIKTLFNYIHTANSKNEEEYKPASSAVNRAYIWEEAQRAIQRKPFEGYGIENITRSMRNKMRSRSVGYFLYDIVDRAHNYYLDLLIEGGITHLILYAFLIIMSLYLSIVNGMAFLGIALIGYSADLFFSFPLQANYIFSFIIITLTGLGGLTGYIHSPALIIIFALLGLLNALGFLFAHKNNIAQRQLRTALSIVETKPLLTKDDIKTITDALLDTVKQAPFEQTYYSIISNILDKLLSTGKLQWDDISILLSYIESAQDLIDKAEAPDITYGTIALIYAVVFDSTQNSYFATEAWEYAKKGLKANPHSVVVRRAIVTILTGLAKIYERTDKKVSSLEYKQASLVVEGIIKDILNAPYPNKLAEQPFWDAFFQLSQDKEKIYHYKDIYNKRFKI